MIEHIKNNKFLIIILIIIILSDIIFKVPSLGSTWTKLHANSLIGVQKFVETNFFYSNLVINFWESYIIIFLSYKITTILFCVFLFIFFIKIILKLNPLSKQL